MNIYSFKAFCSTEVFKDYVLIAIMIGEEHYKNKFRFLFDGQQSTKGLKLEVNKQSSKVFTVVFNPVIQRFYMWLL